MEKKNMVLLTVIAVATLLVAVVGATFAYYTASVKVSNAEQNTTTIKTKALASATMTNGATIDSTGAVPGFAAAKKITIKGACGGSENETCDPIKAKLSVDATIDEAFGSDVSWYLIKTNNEITCTNTIAGNATEETGVYIAEENCTGLPEEFNPEDGTGVFEEAGTKMYDSKTGKKEVTITVNGDTNDTYYLYVKYKNNQNQNTQQGKTFTATLGFDPVK